MEYLTIEDILQIHQDVIEDSGGGTGIRDSAGIESAVANPQMDLFGSELYPTIAEKAAILCFTVVEMHPFVDGNKRAGHSAMVHFLFMNGYILDADDNEQEKVILDLAAGQLEKEPFTAWVKTRIKPL